MEHFKETMGFDPTGGSNSDLRYIILSLESEQHESGYNLEGEFCELSLHFMGTGLKFIIFKY